MILPFSAFIDKKAMQIRLHLLLWYFIWIDGKTANSKSGLKGSKMLNVHERCSIWRPLFPAAILLSALLVSRLIISKPMNGRTGGRLVFFLI